jgi:serine phosphatase RsbU (regulator of sigma subunit)
MVQEQLTESGDLQTQAEKAAQQGNWKVAMELFSQCVEQHSAELSLITSVQEGLSSKLDMQGIYNLVGDKLRDTFNAQVVMISQYDPNTNKIFHHYAIERGQHLQIQDWQPLDSSRGEIIRSRKPFMINQDEIFMVVSSGNMNVVPGTELPKTWLGVPMLVGGEARGVVSLQNLDKENAFTKTDIDLLMTLTNSMSLSLENARLFNETERLLNLMEGEMKIAYRTQRSILPLHTPHHEGYDFGSLITPARAVGGDFYDFIPLDKNRICLIIGDVSDKGLPAALFMALTFSLLRAETEHSNDTRQILRSVNRYLLKMNASGMYVTLLYGILDCTSGKFKYTRAGHLPPIIMGDIGQVIELKFDQGQALGVIKNIKLGVQEVIIPLGGVLLLFSDGLNEAVDSKGNEFGIENIQKELHKHRHKNSKVICKKLWEAVGIHSGDMSHQDDFTTVVVKRRPLLPGSNKAIFKGK